MEKEIETEDHQKETPEVKRPHVTLRSMTNIEVKKKQSIVSFPYKLHNGGNTVQIRVWREEDYQNFSIRFFSVDMWIKECIKALEDIKAEGQPLTKESRAINADRVTIDTIADTLLSLDHVKAVEVISSGVGVYVTKR